MSAKQAIIQTHIRKEKERIMSAFATNTWSKHRAVTKITKTILLNGPYLLSGRYWDVKARSLGAGVYELSLVQIND